MLDKVNMLRNHKKERNKQKNQRGKHFHQQQQIKQKVNQRNKN